MTAALFVPLGLAALAALGDLAAGSVRADVGRSGAGRLGLALLLGPGLAAFALFCLDRLGVPLAPATCRTLAVAVAVAWFARQRARPLDPTAAAPPSAGPRAARATLAAAAVLAVLLGALFAAATPPAKDALVNWSLKARVLFHDGTLNSADFQGQERLLFHPNYPLLVPLAEVFLFGVAGEACDQAAKLVASLGHAGVALLAYAFFARRTGRGFALVMATLIATIPHFYRTDGLYRFAGSVPSGYGDPWFAALAAATCIIAAEWLETRSPRDAATAGLCLGLALFTKNEALPFALALAAGIGAAVLLARRRGAPWPPARSVAAAVLAAGIIALPWLGFAQGLPEVDENYHHRLTDSKELAAGAGRLPVIAAVALEEALAVDTHGLAWPLALAALVVLRRRALEPVPALLLAVILCMAPVYALVFAVTPLPVVDLLVTSIARTFFHLDAVALLLAGVLAAPPRGGNLS